MLPVSLSMERGDIRSEGLLERPRSRRVIRSAASYRLLDGDEQGLERAGRRLDRRAVLVTLPYYALDLRQPVLRGLRSEPDGDAEYDQDCGRHEQGPLREEGSVDE
jgi:hypothetical protein